MKLTAASLVETVVTLAAAAMMTVAGFAMVDDGAPSIAVGAAVATRAAASPPPG